jgi:hypothetical protein
MEEDVYVPDGAERTPPRPDGPQSDHVGSSFDRLPSDVIER